MRPEDVDEPFFIRFLHWFFRRIADLVCYIPWTLVVVSLILAALASVKIPITRLENDITDLIPLDAPARHELKVTREFFKDLIPNAIFAFVTAKKEGDNLFTLDRMNATVELLDMITSKFKLKTPDGPKSFSEFCHALCQINEPIRYFHAGMVERQKYGEASFLGKEVIDNETVIPALDLSYPDARVAGGIRFHMDAYLYGVKVETVIDGKKAIVWARDDPLRNNFDKHDIDNVRSIELIVLIFKSEHSPAQNKYAIEEYEHEMTMYFAKEFKSDHIAVNIIADSFITEEIVRSGMSLTPFLVIGFCIMVVFSSGTFLLSSFVQNQLNWDKIILAWFACACPFIACGFGLGAMLWCGVRFGSILCVTPFLVLAIGVDDSYLMVNAWQQITTKRVRDGLFESSVDLELRARMRQVLTDAGPSISITLLTNVIGFIIGAYTSPPEITLFSWGNLVCVTADFFFTMSIFASVMAIIGRREIVCQFKEKIRETNPNVDLDSGKWKWPFQEHLAIINIHAKRLTKTIMATTKKLLRMYCQLLSNKIAVMITLFFLACYLIFFGRAALTLPVAIRPQKLFLHDSPFVKSFLLREKYMNPFYSPLWIYVSKPGDIWDAENNRLIKQMVNDFESMPESVGQYATKFWMREFESYVKESPDLVFDGDISNETQMIEATLSTDPEVKYGQLRWFLAWPENAPWKGFMQFQENVTVVNDKRLQPRLTAFYFTTAYQGEQLRDWKNRDDLLKKHRALADKYSQFEVSVYQEDGKFLDLFDIIGPQAYQSVYLTFICMFFVAMLFIPQPVILLTATLSILSTTIGVFGVLYYMGFELEPVMMSAMIMSVGFAVDIPAHIAFHYHLTERLYSDVTDRLQRTVVRVGFPIAEASASTILCVGALLIVEVYMARVFAYVMLLVVIFGTIHGLVIMPVVFAAADHFSCRRKKVSPLDSKESSPSSTSTSIPISYAPDPDLKQ